MMANQLGVALLNKLETSDKISVKNYRIYNRDAQKLSQKILSKEIKVDSIITDPPYNISKENNFSTIESAKIQGVDFSNEIKN